MPGQRYRVVETEAGNYRLQFRVWWFPKWCRPVVDNTYRTQAEALRQRDLMNEAVRQLELESRVKRVVD